MRIVGYGGLVLACGALIGAIPPQADRRPTISVETALVMLPVTVVDAQGGFVPGLSRDRFTVYDNGVPQPIQFFTSEDTPVTVGLLIDSSASMRTHRDTVTAAATAFAQSSHPLDELFTVNFNEAVWLGLPPSIPFAANIGQLQAALARAPSRGMTALFDALVAAIDHSQLGSCDRKALIVVSDGGDNASRQSLDTVLERAHLANTVIHAITLVNPDDPEAKPQVMRRLAHDTGGRAFAPVSPSQVMSAFTEIAREIRNGYTIGFSPTVQGARGFRSIKVVADAGNHRQFIVRTRAGYYAGPRQESR